jgi:chromosome segregation ATPase
MIPLETSAGDEDNVPKRESKRLRSKRETWCPSSDKTVVPSKENDNPNEDKDYLKEKVEQLYSQLGFAMIAIKERDITIESLTSERDDLVQRFEVEVGASAECERELRSELNALEDVVIGLKDELQTMTSDRDEKVFQLYTQHDLHEDTSRSIKEQVEKLSAEVDEKNQELVQLASTIESLQSEHNDISQKLQQSEEVVAAEQMNRASVEQEYASLAASNALNLNEIDSLKAELESWDERYTESMSTIQNLTSQLSAAEASTMHLDSARAEITRLESMIVELETKKVEAENDFQGLLTSLQAQLIEKDEALAASCSIAIDREAILEQIKNLEAQLNDSQELVYAKSVEVDDLKNQLAAMTEQRSTLEEQMMVHEQSFNKQQEVWIDEIKDMFALFCSDCSPLDEGESMSTDQAILLLSASVHDAKSNYDSSIETLLTQLSDAERSLNEKQTAFDEQVEELNALVNCLKSELVAKAEEYSTKLAAISSEYDDKLAQLQSQSDENGSSAEDLIKLQQVVEESSARVSELETELASAEEFIGGLENDVKNLSLELQESHNREEALVNAVQESDNEAQSLRDQIVELEHQLEGAVEDYNNSLVEIEKLREAGQTANTSESQLVEAVNARMVAEKTAVELEEKVLTLQNMLTTMNQDSSKMSSHLESKEKEMHVEIEQLSKLLGLKEAELSKLSHSNNELQNNLQLAEQQLSGFRSQASLASDDEHSLKKKVSQLQTTYDLVQSEKDVLQRKHQESLSEIKSLQHDFSKLEESMVSKSKELDKERASYAAAKSEYQANLENIKLLQATNADFKLQVNELKAQLIEATKQLTEFEQLESKAGQSSISVESYEEMIAELKSNVSEMSVRYNKAKDEIQMYTSELNRSNDLIEKYSNEIDVLKTELVEAQEKSAAVVAKYDIEVAQQNSNLRDRIAELEASLEDVSLREHQAQEKYQVERLALEEAINSYEARIKELEEQQDANIRDASLIDEMNALMEAKLEVESKLATSEQELQETKQKLFDYDRSSAKEQQMIMNAASREIEALKTKLETSQSTITSLQDELGVKVAALLEKEDSLVTAMNDLRQLRDDLKLARSMTSEALVELQSQNQELQAENQMLVEEIANKKKEMDILKKESSAAQSEIASIRIEMDEQLALKDQRIVHLEASKLTKDQLEKIKVMKEERKKYMEEAKTLKKQLSVLKQSYDELKANPTGSSSTSSSVDSVELQEKYSMSQEIVKTLKEKLRECSKQLQVDLC